MSVDLDAYQAGLRDALTFLLAGLTSGALDCLQPCFDAWRALNPSANPAELINEVLVAALLDAVDEIDGPGGPGGPGSSEQA